MSKRLRYSFLSSLSAPRDISSKSGERRVYPTYASYILSTLRGLVKYIVQIVAMANRCSISNYFSRYTNSKLAIPLLQTNVKKKIVFLEQQFFGIAFLYIDQQHRQRLLGFWGLAANNSSGDLHSTYVKQTKAFGLIRFGDKHKGKLLEALILKQVIQF